MINELQHYGIKRRSGRYEWGSGEDPQRSKSLSSYIKDMKAQGLKETEIAASLGYTTSELRARRGIEANAKRASNACEAVRLKEKGMSNVAIGERMGMNESSVRSLLSYHEKDKKDIYQTTSEMLKKAADEKGFVDIGSGVERYIGVPRTTLNTSLALLKDQGYNTYPIQVEQLGTNHKTTLKILCPPGTTHADVYKNQDKISFIQDRTEDKGRTYLGMDPIKSVSSDRLKVRYAEEGGTDRDGVIQLRRGVNDLNLGAANYAQVRIAVDGTHYLKGMAMYADDLPKGVDMVFNTNKSDTGNKLDALKKMKDDPDNPFGATIKTQDQLVLTQKTYTDPKTGKKELSALNIVSEEGNWGEWSKTISSQMLSKQNVSLAKQQLALAEKIRKEEFDTINSLTNPVIKQKLLLDFAEGADAASIDLKAAALPRQGYHVILPYPNIKENQVYAPNYKNGESVVLIRFPHGGTFEIPELTVNNKFKEAKDTIGSAIDGIGIHPKVAERLSGADFDGDTTLVIPNNDGKITTKAALEGLKNFDPKAAYPAYEGMKPMTKAGTGLKMGDISNLITDMTIQKADPDEICRAVRHSMVVIDAEKHKLNYKQSHIDHGIAELKTKYQGSARSGASTLISKASSTQYVDARKTSFAIDPYTGEKIYKETGEVYFSGKKVQTKSTKMGEAKNAYALSSGTAMEGVYADYANNMKALGNDARKLAVNTTMPKMNPQAKIDYMNEVNSLNSKLDIALRNAPLERIAQVSANAVVKAKQQDNPNMASDELRRLKGQALTGARLRVGASKQAIEITPKEWEAIQAGAISVNKLQQIIANSNIDSLKQLAMPRQTTTLTKAKTSQIEGMMARGYTQAEVAELLGISTSTINEVMKG